MNPASAARSPIGVLGGTFNPIHFGHLRSALELVEQVGFEQLRLMPSAVPPHREPPRCSAAHRAAMVELAVADEPRLMCDHRELRRSGPSYTIDSLIELNDELNDACSLTLVMGCDALLGLATWHRWEELLDWAHVLVIARPGWQLPTLGPVADWLAEHPPVSPAIVQRQRAGAVMIEEMRPLPISATEIRDLLREGRSARYLLPEGVLRYIERCELYR